MNASGETAHLNMNQIFSTYLMESATSLYDTHRLVERMCYKKSNMYITL